MESNSVYLKHYGDWYVTTVPIGDLVIEQGFTVIYVGSRFEVLAIDDNEVWLRNIKGNFTASLNDCELLVRIGSSCRSWEGPLSEAKKLLEIKVGDSVDVGHFKNLKVLFIEGDDYWCIPDMGQAPIGTVAYKYNKSMITRV